MTKWYRKPVNGARSRARHSLSNDRGTLADSNFAYNLFYVLWLSHKSKLHNGRYELVGSSNLSISNEKRTALDVYHLYGLDKNRAKIIRWTCFKQKDESISVLMLFCTTLQVRNHSTHHEAQFRLMIETREVVDLIIASMFDVCDRFDGGLLNVNTVQIIFRDCPTRNLLLR